MIGKQRVVALIPARGGSKGIKNKNIVDICGKPLIAYTIEAARQSRYLDRIIVSTDSESIMQVAIKYGADVPFLRPKQLASDTASTLEVVLHLIEYLAKAGDVYNTLMLLQPTSPLRSTEEIDGALEKYCNNGLKSLVSVSEVTDPPILMRYIVDKTHMENLLSGNSTIRRQDMEKIYRVNGSIYINNIKEIHNETSFKDNEIPYIMKKEHSVDIDEYVDIERVKFYLKEGDF